MHPRHYNRMVVTNRKLSHKRGRYKLCNGIRPKSFKRIKPSFRVMLHIKVSHIYVSYGQGFICVVNDIVAFKIELYIYIYIYNLIGIIIN